MIAKLQIMYVYPHNLNDRGPRIRKFLKLPAEEENLFKSHFDFQFACLNYLQ